MKYRSFKAIVASAILFGSVTALGGTSAHAAAKIESAMDHYPRTTGLNTTGDPEQFWVQGDQVFHQYGSHGAWSTPSGLGGPTPGIKPSADPAVPAAVGYALNYLNNPELYVLGKDGNVWHDFATPGRGSGWSGWGPMGHPASGISGGVVVGRNYLNNQELYVLGLDGQIYHSFSTPGIGTGWSNWDPMGRPGPGVANGGDVHVNRNDQNNQELYVTASDGQVWHDYSTPGVGSGWSGWSPVGSPSGGTGDVGIWRNWAQNQEMFKVIGNTVWHDWATPGVGSGWSGWYPLADAPAGVNLTGWIGLSDDKDIGQLTLWIADTAGRRWNTMLNKSNAWSSWTTIAPVLPPPPPSVVVVPGVIHAPYIGDWNVVEGTLANGIVNTSQFNAGVVHMPGTANLCAPGNSVLGAHRTTAPAPFNQIDKLSAGMTVSASQNGTSCTYQVVESHVDYVGTAAAAANGANDVLDQSPRFGYDHRLTLFACSKPDRSPTSTSYRIVVSLVQI